jgi:hypothetical protein
MRAWFEAQGGLARAGAWLLSLALGCSGFWVTVRLAPYSALSPLSAYGVAFCCVVLCVFGASLTAPMRSRALAAGAIAGLLGLVFAARMGERAGIFEPLSVLVGLLLVGSSIGAWVGARIQHPAHVMFVALVSGIADTLSVTQPGGVSATIVEHPHALALLALPWPMLGTREIAPLLGVGDIIFTSLYIRASRTHHLPLARTVLALAVGYVITTAAVVVWSRPIPVLPLLGAAVVLAQPRTRSIAPSDRRRGAWVITALAGMIAVWILRRSL